MVVKLYLKPLTLITKIDFIGHFDFFKDYRGNVVRIINVVDEEVHPIIFGWMSIKKTCTRSDKSRGALRTSLLPAIFYC